MKQMIVRRAVIAALSLTVPAAAAAQQNEEPARPISLDEAVRLGQRNAPLAVQARGQVRAAEATASSARAAFIPALSLNMSASYNPAAESRFDQQSGRLVAGKWVGSQGLGANVNLFDGGRRIFDYRAAQAQVGAAEANEVAQTFRVALDIQQAYFNALAARESEAAALSQLEQAQQQLRASSARVAAGVATRSDSLRSVILVGNAQLAMLTAQNNLRSANATLTRIVATPYTVTAEPSDTMDLPRTVPDSAQLLQLALQGPAVQQAQAQRVAARGAARAARTPYLPNVDVSYQYSGTRPGDNYLFGFGEYGYQSNLRFSLSYPIFNQLNREANRVRADVALVNADAQLRDARFAAEQQLIQQLGTLGTAQQRVEIQTASVEAAEEDLRVQQQRYAVGASTLLDVLTSQTQLTQARAALIQARYDYRVARATIEALIGRTL